LMKLFRNGRIYTLEGEAEPCEAMLVAGGIIRVTGSYSRVKGFASEGVNEVDLEGKTVIPGLVDSHMHLLSYGLSLQALELKGTTSLVEMLRKVETATTAAKPGDWIVGRGWDQDYFNEGRYPVREDLDWVSGDSPVFLRRACGHIAIANSKALLMAGVDRDTADPEGGKVDRDASGEPTGILRETAMGLVGGVVPRPTHDQMKQALHLAMDRVLAVGITSVHTDDVGTVGGLEDAVTLYREVISERGASPRVYLDVSVSSLDELEASPWRTGHGDAQLTIGAVKCFADGSLGGGTAALTEDYRDEPGNRGIFIHSPDAFKGLVGRAHRIGMQVAVHAIGDAAIDLALDAFKGALKERPRLDHRHRVIHCQIMRDEQYDTFAKLGVVADIQPIFVGTDKQWVEARVGKDRARSSYGWRTMLERGVTAAGGSDAPVEPPNPFWGIYSAVTRADLAGTPAGGWYPEQRLTVDEALRLFTLGGAYGAFQEHLMGSLVPGKAADFTVVDRDPYEVEPESLKDVKVLNTYVGGRG